VRAAKRGYATLVSPQEQQPGIRSASVELDLAQCPAATFFDFELMTTKMDEQRRLKARIVALERGLAEAREKNVGAGSRFLGDAEQDQMLHMLARTLKALKARQGSLHLLIQ